MNLTHPLSHCGVRTKIANMSGRTPPHSYCCVNFPSSEKQIQVAYVDLLDILDVVMTGIKYLNFTPSSSSRPPPQRWPPRIWGTWSTSQRLRGLELTPPRSHKGDSQKLHLDTRHLRSWWGLLSTSSSE